MGKENIEYGEATKVITKAYWDGLINLDLHQKLLATLQEAKNCNTSDRWEKIEAAEGQSEHCLVTVQEVEVLSRGVLSTRAEGSSGEAESTTVRDATPETTEMSEESEAVPGETTEIYGSRDRRESGDARGAKGRHSFAWCPCCGMMRVAIFGNEGVGLSRLHSTMAVYCGGCSREKGEEEEEGAKKKKKKKKKQRKKDSLMDDDISYGPEWKGLNISPEVWRRSEVSEIAKAVIGKEVDFLSDGKGGTAYMEAAEFLRTMGKRVQVRSIDVGGFRAGKRKDLVLPYLEGGFL